MNPTTPRAGRALTATLATLALTATAAASATAPSPFPVPDAAASTGVRLATRELPTGVTIHYAEQGDPTGEPVILLHGFTDSLVSWNRVLPLLPSGLHVFALSNRGHGDSSRPESGYTLPQFAADVLAFMDAVDLPRATVVGHSMGSLIAQQVAIAAPHRVTRLVLEGTLTTARNIPGADELGRAIELQPDPIPEPFAREFQVSCVHVPVPAEFMDRVVGESLKVPARVWRAVWQGLVASPADPRLVTVTAPTLIFWGDREPIAPRADQDALLRLLPNATLKVYEETGHSPHWERPERFVRDLLAFIGEADPGRGEVTAERQATEPVRQN
jgi:pimeloyl-ACP methyl ester carboxylesterase